MIGAVVVDLDDTLFPQSAFLEAAWVAVAAAAGDADGRLLAALHAVASEGSDRGAIIDRSLARVNREITDVRPLVRAFRGAVPPTLPCYPGVPEALAALREVMPVALLTDGDPVLQLAKLQATGLGSAVDVVVLSDELGRERRKPDPAPFLAAAAALDLEPERCVMVGDRPDKDVAGAHRAGYLGAVRVRTGEYAACPDMAGTLASVDTLAHAVAFLLERRIRPSIATTNAAAPI